MNAGWNALVDALSRYTPAQGIILVVLFRHQGEVMSMRKLAACAGLTLRHTVTCVERLIAAGAVTRTPAGSSFAYTLAAPAFAAAPAAADDAIPVADAPDLAAAAAADDVTPVADAPDFAAAAAADDVTPVAGAARRSRKGKERQEALNIDDPISIYQRVCEVRPNREQRRAIAEQVTDVDTWRTVCQYWRRNGYVVQRVDTMLRAYHERTNKNRDAPESDAHDKIMRVNTFASSTSESVRARIQNDMRAAIARARERFAQEAAS